MATKITQKTRGDTPETFEDVNVKDQLGKPADKGLFLFRKKEEFEIIQGPTQVYQKNTTTSSIYGLAVYGTNYYMATAPTGFILGSVSGSGVLGLSVLGTIATDDILQHVVNPNNTFYDFLYTDTFNDTTVTTATWASDGEISFTSGQIAQTTPVFYDVDGNDIVESATLNVEIDSGTFTLELSANGGTDWETVTSGTPHLFINTGSDLRMKLSITSIGWSASWGVWGAIASGNITGIDCSYTLI
jgi:hypothetical protein